MYEEVREDRAATVFYKHDSDTHLYDWDDCPEATKEHYRKLIDEVLSHPRIAVLKDYPIEIIAQTWYELGGGLWDKLPDGVQEMYLGLAAVVLDTLLEEKP